MPSANRSLPFCHLKAIERHKPIFSHHCKFCPTVTLFFPRSVLRGFNQGQGAWLLSVKLQTASISGLTLCLGPVLDELSMRLRETWVRKCAPGFPAGGRYMFRPYTLSSCSVITLDITCCWRSFQWTWITVGCRTKFTYLQSFPECLRANSDSWGYWWYKHRHL